MGNWQVFVACCRTGSEPIVMEDKNQSPYGNHEGFGYRSMQIAGQSQLPVEQFA